MPTITVTSTADQGAGSLRHAIANAKKGDTIQFAQNLAKKTIKLTSGQLLVNKSITIDGKKAPGLVISGNNASRVFKVEREQNVTFKNLIIADGKTKGAGGGIDTRHESTLNLFNVELRNNKSELGGGLRVGHLAKANIINSRFKGNDGLLTDKHKGFSGGAISHSESRGQLFIKGSTFENNRGFNGGAIYSFSSVSFNVEDSVFRNNVSTNEGGAIFTDGVSSNNYFGPVNEGTIDIQGSRFEGNQTKGDGGALYLWGYIRKQPAVKDRAIIKDTVIIDNKAAGNGGAVWAKMGLNFQNVTFADNTATKQGGGLWVESTLPANIVNSTFSGNRASNDAGGAMFLNNRSVPINITNSTIAYNSAGRANGALWYGKNHAVTLKNSIVAFNTADKDKRQNQVGFQALDGGGNLEFSSDRNSLRVLKNSLVADPKLAPLQQSNGSLVHPLRSNSPAIDSGIRAGAPAVDQRGLKRDNRVDIGAFESTSSPTPKASDNTIGEYGNLTLNHNWKTISLDDTYKNPVVIVSDPTLNGSDPVTVRLRNVGKQSFQIRLQEPNYKDGNHIDESVSYLVMEAGDWTLADGTRISAGTHSSSRLTSKGFDSVNLTGFDTAPTVLSQVQTENGGDWVTTRIKQQSSQGFQLAMQEEEALNKGGHVTESLGWLAIDQGKANDGDTLLQGGTTGRSYDHNSSKVNFASGFDAAPSLIAKLGSFYGGDTANVRVDDITRQSFGVSVYEDKSLDSEINHTSESVSFLALEGKSGFLSGVAV
ncbi:MAG: choice-of-anchor Q domain-containing protein [Cyanobacteria bacterium P01_F01_bin.86]